MTTSKPLGLSAASVPIAAALFLGLVNHSYADVQLDQKLPHAQTAVSFSAKHHWRFAKYYHRRPAAGVIPRDQTAIVPSPVMDTGLGLFSGTGDGSAGSWAADR